MNTIVIAHKAQISTALRQLRHIQDYWEGISPHTLSVDEADVLRADRHDLEDAIDRLEILTKRYYPPEPKPSQKPASPKEAAILLAYLSGI